MTTTPNAVEVLDHNDALGDVITSLLRDCTLAGLRPVHLSVAVYSPGFYSASVQFRDVAAADTAAGTWKLRPDTGEGSNHTRTGSIDVNGQTVTVAAYTGRPKLPTYPADYAPVAVTA